MLSKFTCILNNLLLEGVHPEIEKHIYNNTKLIAALLNVQNSIEFKQAADSPLKYNNFMTIICIPEDLIKSSVESEKIYYILLKSIEEFDT
jgi:hypothetical protein